MNAYSPQPRLDYRRLWHPWWYVPVLMIVASYAWFLFILYMVHWKFNALPLALVFDYARNLTLVTGVLGLIFGLWLTFRARKAFDDGLSVFYLGSGHALTQRVHRLAGELGLPPPAVGTMWAANAYAAGSDVENAAVVIGQPLINILTEEELDAIIGHELGHIASGDVQRMQFAVGYQQTYVRILKIIGKILHFATSEAGNSRRREGQEAQLGLSLGAVAAFLLCWIVALGSELVLKFLSRSREYHADAMGAALTSPAAMASALVKVHAMDYRVAGEYSHFMFFGAQGLFATHPSLKARYSALEKGHYLRELLDRASTHRRGRYVAVPRPSPKVTLGITAGLLASVGWFWLTSNRVPQTQTVPTLKEEALETGQVEYTKMVAEQETIPHGASATSPAEEPDVSNTKKGSALQQMIFVTHGFKAPPYERRYEIKNAHNVLVERRAHKFEFTLVDDCTLDASEVSVKESSVHNWLKEETKDTTRYNFRKIEKYKAKVMGEIWEALYLALAGSRQQARPAIYTYFSGEGGACTLEEHSWCAREENSVGPILDLSITPQSLLRTYEDIGRRCKNAVTNEAGGSGKADRQAAAPKGPTSYAMAPKPVPADAGTSSMMVTQLPATTAMVGRNSLQAKAEDVGLSGELDRAILQEFRDRDFENASIAISAAILNTADGATFTWPDPPFYLEAQFKVTMAGSRAGCRSYDVVVRKGGREWIAPRKEWCRKANRG